ncbi:phytoene desaturase family protein [Nocardioides antri]|uniref:Pyridine nucleotide-disulfide oxidoreductase domain-containing protein 2 n=1 Tax=Nocardioides antri TaxID=2607659 RepID=A0A5B1M453_9ACTN|nr:NAD(P)/FAD-dependent oxidoreductase [Nocardioides antri]KAA1427544.1 NAD(P)/FAD-dependent oxidoreductase [Nocardioides antri]
MTLPDAVVVGAGPNGLVAANRLADAGWSVLLLEAQPEVGGAVRSDRELDPQFVHDTFSAFYPLGVASPALRALQLERHGLRWRHAPAALGHPTDDGWALLHRDRELTARLLDEAHGGDGAAWLELVATWDRIGDDVLSAVLSPFPPVRTGLRAMPRVARAGGLDLVRTLLSPVLELARERFAGPRARLLLAGNAAHSDIPLTAPGSGLLGVMLAMLGQTVGFPVPEGGAGRLSAALAARLTAAGGEIRCDTEVVGIETADGRVAAVRTADGERIAVRRAVLADVSAPALFGRLLAPADVPARVHAGMRRFRPDPGTVKVDWALAGPVPWAEPPVVAPGTIHLADSLEDLAIAFDQVTAGVVPTKPFLVAGRMTTADPTRSPPGTESVWAYTHVPQPGDLVGDAGEEIAGRWDHDDLERMADRIQAQFERRAPGFGALVRARRVLGPLELESRNANLIGGAIGGGTSQLQQQLVFRPIPALRGRPETGVPGLYLASSAAHPGGGVHGACGNNAARAALLHDRVRSTLRRA